MPLPTNGRLYPRGCHREADQRSALPPRVSQGSRPTVGSTPKVSQGSRPTVGSTPKVSQGSRPTVGSTPRVSQGSRPTVGSTPEGVTGKPTNGRLYPEGVTGKPTNGRLYPQGHTQTKTAPSRAPFCCVSCCPRHARASRDARLRPRRRLHAAPALPSVWPVHAGIPQPLRSAPPPALPAGEPQRWPLRPGQHSAGWHRPSEPPSG